MKKLISLVVILFAFTLMSFSQTPVDLYEKYKDNKDVTAMVMNEELFKMVEGMEIDVQEEVNTVLDEINRMVILSSTEINFLDEVDLKGYDELMNVNEGEEATLYWDVSGADTIAISPDIGCVANSGSRVIYPEPNNVYRLSAVNDAGETQGMVRIIINPKVLKVKKEVYCLVGESGYVDKNGKVGQTPMAGDTSNGVSIQAFISFDISGIPVGTTLSKAELDLSQFIMLGNPFGVLGAMGVFHHQYETLSKEEFITNQSFFGITPYRTIVIVYVKPEQPYSNDSLRYAVQEQLDDGSSRFQIRVQFEKLLFYNQLPDYIEFVPDRVKLTVEYNE